MRLTPVLRTGGPLRKGEKKLGRFFKMPRKKLSQALEITRLLPLGEK